MSTQCPEMFLVSSDFLITCRRVAGALEAVDVYDGDHEKAEVNEVDLEELLED